MPCKGICTRHKAKFNRHSGDRYQLGQRRCSVCEIFIYWEGQWCPCCGYRLRNKPRNRRYANRFSKPKRISNRTKPKPLPVELRSQIKSSQEMVVISNDGHHSLNGLIHDKTPVVKNEVGEYLDKLSSMISDALGSGNNNKK